MSGRHSDAIRAMIKLLTKGIVNHVDYTWPTSGDIWMYRTDTEKNELYIVLPSVVQVALRTEDLSND